MNEERILVESAVYCLDVASQITNDDVKKRFRSRARTFFELITYSGAPLSLAYLSAKSGEKLLFKFYRILLEGYGRPASDVASKIDEESGDGGPEEISYALYGASLLLILTKLRGEEYKRIDELVSIKAFDRLFQSQLEKAARWVKLLSEAKLPSGE